MKTNVVLGLTVSAMMFASCERNDVTNVSNRDDNVIGFEVSTGKTTKSSVANLSALQSDANGFGIYATKGASSALFIDNKAYKYDGGIWKWAEASILWPSETTDYPVNFYAYHPKANTSLNASLTADYTVAAMPEDQKDLLAANQTGVTVRPASSDVALSFKHMLSKVDFKVVTGADVTVEIQSIAVKKVGNNGTFNYASLAWSAAPTAFNSAYDYMTAQMKPANVFAGVTTAKDVKGSSGSLMLMPQNLSARAWDKTITGLAASQSYIEVVYRVYETATGKDIIGYGDAANHPNNTTVTGSLFVKVAYPLPTNWAMGKAYVYTIYLADGNSSGGNLIDEKFVDENGNDSKLPVIYPETGEKIDVLDPIFPDKPIGFIIVVEDWGTQNTTPLQ
jgi:hypothetical protein